MREQPFTRKYFERERYAISFEGEESRTHQEMAESADINNIMRQYERNNLVDHVNQYQGHYGS